PRGTVSRNGFFPQWRATMKKMWQGGSLVVLVLVVAVAAIMFSINGPTAPARAADEAKSTGGPRYTVIETQGFNLLVTDNAARKRYYLAADKDGPVGAPLKLRASLDLTKVGENELTLKAHNLENIRKREAK